MSPRTPIQLNEIREEKRALIMDTALKLFAEDGYYNTSIDKIARTAGISKGLVYNYFNSKDALLSEIFHFGLDELFRSFDPNRDGILTKDELILFIDNSISEIRSNTDFWKLYYILLMKPVVYKMFEESFRDFLEPIFKMLENYFSMQGSKDPVAEARLLGAVLDGIGMHFLTHPGNFPIDKIRDIIVEKYI